jgi:hypothetical protein
MDTEIGSDPAFLEWGNGMGVIVSVVFCALAIIFLYAAIVAEEKHQRQIVQGSRLAAHIRKTSAT